MKTHNFNNSIVVGKDGEKVIQTFIESFGGVDHYEDVSDNKTYQDINIDGVIHMKGGRTRTVEIKTDTYTSGNIFFETESNVEFNTPGCMLKTDAEFLYYYFPNFRILYVIDMKKYRLWFNLHKHMFRHTSFKNVNKRGTGTYHSAGYLIPMKYFEEKFKAKFWKKYDMTRWQENIA